MQTNEGNRMIVQGKYPDAREHKYALRSMCIWSNVLNRRLSGFFLTFDEAWEDAVKWINKIPTKTHSQYHYNKNK